MRRVGWGLVLGLLMCGAGCAALGAPGQIAGAINRVDLEGLRNAAEHGNEAEQQFAAAIELAWLKRDAEASVELRKAAGAVRTPVLRMQALKTLSEVLMRTGAYAEAAAARRGTISSALLETPPMTLSGKTLGAVPVRIDSYGHPRTTVSFGNEQREAILDTGASFSVISESAAARLGLRFLPDSVNVRSIDGSSIPSRLAVANEIAIGEARFQHVIFGVVPDEAMTLLQGQYKIDVVIGLPIFLKLGRIAVLPADDRYVFVFGPSGRSPSERSNLRLDGSTPIVAAILHAKEPVPVNLLLDTGATGTSFTGRLSALIPDIVAAAPEVQSVRSGIGVDMAASNARRLGPLALTVGGLKLTLTGANLLEGPGRSYHGILGQDVLKVGFVADFDAMTFELGPQSRTPQ